ncbi:MAG: acyltransferase family protein [Bdellovibrionota bacterium]
MAGRGSEKNQRLVAIDGLRGVAIVLMFITHFYRLYEMSPGRSKTGDLSVLDLLLKFFIKVEPLTFALFLALSGFSLALAAQKFQGDQVQWLRKLGKRSLELIFWSSLLFVFRRGPQWPDFIFSSGPLCVIGFAALWFGGGLKSTRPKLWLFFTTASVFLATLVLGAQSLTVSGLNAGNGGVLPDFAFAAYGIWIGMAYAEKGLIKARHVCILLGLLGLIGFATPEAWTHFVKSQYVLYGNDETVIGWIRSLSHEVILSSYFVSYWHYTISATVRLAFPLAVLIGSSLAFNKSFMRLPGFSVLVKLGEYALSVYILQLIVLGVLFTAKVFPSEAWQTWLMIIALVAFSYFFVRARQAYRI